MVDGIITTNVNGRPLRGVWHGLTVPVLVGPDLDGLQVFVHPFVETVYHSRQLYQSLFIIYKIFLNAYKTKGDYFLR